MTSTCVTTTVDVTVFVRDCQYLGEFDGFGFRVVLVGAADKQPEECVELFPAVSVYCGAHGPDDGKQE